MIHAPDREIAALAGDLTSAGPAPAVVTLTPADLAAGGAELAAYPARFAPYFARREQRGWAEVYLCAGYCWPTSRARTSKRWHSGS
jgi:hypothetical protein